MDAEILAHLTAMLAAALVATVMWCYATPMEHLSLESWLQHLKEFMVASCWQP